MSKKIYDIVPPKESRKVEKAIRFLDAEDKKKLRYKKTANLPHKEKRFPFREIFIGGFIIIALFVVYFVLKLPRADIEIWPKTSTLTLQEKIKADKSADSINLDLGLIPAQYMEEEQESWQEFEATGIATNDGKASGIIKIYNKTDTLAPLTLIKGTHFLSDSGKYFITLGKITIPAAQYKKGKLVPGSINAKVQAKEVGDNHNIGPSKFSVPKLSGTPYYHTIWGESENQMSGGYKGNVKKVTKDDIEKAQNSLEKQLFQESEKSLRNKLSEGDVLLDGAVLRDVVESKALVKSDSIMDNFNVQAKVKVSALVFKKQDLDKLVKDYILSQLEDNQTFLEKSLEVNYGPELVDIKGGKQILNLQSSVKTYHKIITEDLIDLLQRKSASQMEDIINKMYGDKISEVKINFWPFWVNKAPKDKNRINVDLLFE